MNKFVIFGAGVVVGGVASYLFCKKEFKREVEAYKEFLTEKFSDEGEVVTSMDNPEHFVDKIDSGISETAPIGFHWEDVPENDDKVEEIWEPKYDGPMVPHIITREEYLANEEFDKVSYYYYAKDDCLADDGEELIMDDVMDRVIDIEALGLFDPEKGITEIFCRNPISGMDIEIVFCDESYTDKYYGVVGGASDD